MDWPWTGRQPVFGRGYFRVLSRILAIGAIWALSFVVFPKRRHDWQPTSKEDLVIEDPEDSYKPRYHEFLPEPFSTTVESEPRRIGSYESIPLSCLEEWIAQGLWGPLCSSIRLPEPRIDFVWTWVNGS
jgi:hypothetical protein